MTNGNLLTSLRGKRANKVVTWLLFYLECEEEEESHHETEESHGLGQGETQNGVGEELLLQGRVAGITDDERSEDASDTGSGSSYSDGGSSSADELCGRVNVSGHSCGLDGADGSSRNQALF